MKIIRKKIATRFLLTAYNRFQKFTPNYKTSLFKPKNIWPNNKLV